MPRAREELRGHLHRKDVRLVLLRDDRPPQVLAPRLLLIRALCRLRDRRKLVPGQVAHLPLGLLGQVVITQNALVLAARRGRGGLELNGCAHVRSLSSPPWSSGGGLGRTIRPRSKPDRTSCAR